MFSAELSDDIQSEYDVTLNQSYLAAYISLIAILLIVSSFSSVVLMGPTMSSDNLTWKKMKLTVSNYVMVSI